MSSRIHGESAAEISKYLDGLREQKKAREHVLAQLKSERQINIEQLERVKLRLESIEENILQETERVERVNDAITKAETTYAKLLESSQSLLDFLKKEYQELRESPRRFQRTSSHSYD